MELVKNDNEVPSNDVAQSTNQAVGKKPQFINGDLFDFHFELEGKKRSIFYKLLRSSINDFYKNNGVKLNVILEKVSKMQEEYFVIENGKIKTEMLEGASHPTPVCKEGFNLNDYQVKYRELMEEECNIIF